MDRGSPDALLERARRRARRGEVEAARADLDRAVELDPDNPRLHLLRALVLIEVGDPDAAREDVARALGAGGGAGGGAGALALRGWLALHLDVGAAAAERDLSAAVDAGDTQPSTYNTRGWARPAGGDHAGALADARTAAEAAPLDPDARLLSGLVRLHLGDRRGVADLDRAEILYRARGDVRGQAEVWQARAAVRQGAVPARGRVIRLRTGYLTMVVTVVAIRYLVTTAVIALLTLLLPGPSAGPQPTATVLVIGLLYRLLRSGAVSLLASLLVFAPAAALVWMHTGPLPLVGLVRWGAASGLSAGVLAVAGWTSTWLGPAYRIGAPGVVAVVGLVLGLGTFVSFPVLRRTQ
jgi:hypothetical protein